MSADARRQDAVALMYTALVQIGCVSSKFYTSDDALIRIREISDDALQRMNSEHTKLVQVVFGIGGRKKRKVTHGQ